MAELLQKTNNKSTFHTKNIFYEKAYAAGFINIWNFLLKP